MSAECSRRITRLRSRRVRLPLRRPYSLSFARLEAFDAVIVCVEDDAGMTGIGEAVALPGYGWETADDVDREVSRLIEGGEGMTVEALAARARGSHSRHPFAVSVVLGALESASVSSQVHERPRIPLNFPVAAGTSVEALDESIAAALGEGYRFLKAKVGADLQADLELARRLFSHPDLDGVGIVFDANQGHDAAEAEQFSRALGDAGSDRLLWYEQPCHRDDWSSLERLARLDAAPIVMDESVYTIEDVERAERIGARGVKLKACKQAGPGEIGSLCRRATELGLFVVLGNGVATDVSNLLEYLVFASGAKLVPPCESSGFEKLHEPVVYEALRVERGELVCTADAASLQDAARSFAW